MALDPSEHTVDELRDELEDVDDPEELEEILDAERESEDRKTAREAVERRLDDLGEDEAEKPEAQPATAGGSEGESGAAGEGATAESTESGAAGEEAESGARAEAGESEVGGAVETDDAESVGSGSEQLRSRALDDSRRARNRLDERLRSNR